MNRKSNFHLQLISLSSASLSFSSDVGTHRTRGNAALRPELVAVVEEGEGWWPPTSAVDMAVRQERTYVFNSPPPLVLELEAFQGPLLLYFYCRFPVSLMLLYISYSVCAVAAAVCSLSIRAKLLLY